MWAEDYPEQGFQHPPEFCYFVFALFLGVMVFWLLPSQGPVANAMLTSALVVAPALVLFHRREELGERGHPLWFFSLLALPVILSGSVFLLGLLNPATETFSLGGLLFVGLREDLAPGPTTTMAATGWLLFSRGLGVYLVAATVILVVDNEWSLGQLLRWLCVLVTLTAAGGWVQEILRIADDPLGISLRGQFFSGDGFANLAAFWFGLSSVLVAISLERLGWWAFLRDQGIWKLTGWFLLGSSGLYNGGEVQRGVVMFFALGLPVSVLLARLIHRSRSWKSAVTFGVFAALVAVLSPLCPRVGDFAEPGRAVASREAAAVSAVTAAHLGEEWARLRQQRPWSGWGGGSLEHLAALHLHLDLAEGPVVVPMNSIERLLLEHGYPGVALWGLVVVLGLVNLLTLSRLSSYSIGLLVVAASGLCLMLLTAAGRHAGVSFGVWVTFFTAIRWSQIISLRANRISQNLTPTMAFGFGAANLRRSTGP